MIADLRDTTAGPNIEFLGRVSDEKRDEIYSQARALIFPGVEDFGIIPVEAQAAGCPVIAFGQGGALETVVDGKTGLFFAEQTADSRCEAVQKFQTLELSESACRANATRFSNPWKLPTHFSQPLEYEKG
ncbi:MAG: glycosyltransferase [Kiritimatiellales bacterium]|nr:glycosyltransferase [Kiritimatiellales bacterium]